MFWWSHVTLIYYHHYHRQMSKGSILSRGISKCKDLTSAFMWLIQKTQNLFSIFVKDMCSQLRGTLNNCSVLQRYKQVFSQSHCQEDKIIIIVQWQTPRFFLFIFTSSCFLTPENDQEMSNSERGLYGCILHSSGFGLEFYENAIFVKTKCWSDGHRVGIELCLSFWY